MLPADAFNPTKLLHSFYYDSVYQSYQNNPTSVQFPAIKYLILLGTIDASSDSKEKKYHRKSGRKMMCGKVESFTHFDYSRMLLEGMHLCGNSL